jgi:SpoVK/Ycf46/Vps4 family AAA+-type ATPase
VPPPDGTAREAILRILLKEKPIGDDINYEKLARKTKGLSGADLNAIIDIAIEGKLRESMKSGGLMPIMQKDLVQAIVKVPPSTKEWFSTARNYALYSNESGLYDDILAYLNIKK